MIIVTGAAGFIAGQLISRLLEYSNATLLCVDNFSTDSPKQSLPDHERINRQDRETFLQSPEKYMSEATFFFHIGARTDTTEFDKSIFEKLNLSYSKKVWQLCVDYNVPLVYASSAATYGSGEHGYEDNHDIISKLQPLNPYGWSKQHFDEWVLAQTETPPFWAGLKFFNVYGPGESHKGRMASVIWHAFNQIQQTGKMKLFRSHRPDYADGGQLRDFIYVKDIVAICLYLMTYKPHSAIYNAGTGRARTFKDLVTAVFEALDKEPAITYIDTPADIRDKYQYYTQATMDKLRATGYVEPFHTLEQGVGDYIKNELLK